MIRRIITSISLFTLLLIAVPAVASAQAAQIGANPAACTKSAGGFLGFPTWYKYLLQDPPIKDGSCNIKFEFPNDIGKILLAGFEIILRVGGLVAIGFIIYGGFQYIISQGEPDRLKNARTTIINAIVGLVITIFATAIVNLIARNIV